MIDSFNEIMAGDLNDPDLSDFLRRVDELESVVKGETVIDRPQEGSGSTAGGPSAGVRQQRAPVDRTVINRAAFRDDEKTKGIQGKGGNAVSQDNFLRGLEADANERAEKRRRGREEATVLKDQGNQAFQRGDYDRAVELYTEGLGRLKDFVVMYTNRAQAYNKLERFLDAIEDCKTARHLEPSNVKAMVHLGKAQQGLRDYDAAIQTFQEILTIDDKKEKIVREYIEAARLAESMAASATEAERLFEEGDSQAKGVHDILTKLQQPRQPVPYYAGGMRLLGAVINDDSSRAQFRTFGGFNLLTDHAVIQRVLGDAVTGEDLMSSGRDLVCATLDLLTSAVKENEENSAFLTSLSTVPSLVDLLSKASDEIQVCCIHLLNALSQNACGCQGMLEHFDVFRLLTAVMAFLASPKPRPVGTPTAVSNMLSRLIHHERFISRFSASSKSGEFDAYNMAAAELLLNSARIHPAAFLQGVHAMSTLARDRKLRGMMTTPQLLQAAVQSVEVRAKKQENPDDAAILRDLMGLLMNLFAEGCPMEDLGLARELGSLMTVLAALLGSESKDTRQRAVGLLSRVMPTTDEGVADLVQHDIIPKIVDMMKSGDGEIGGPYAMKCLAVLTQRSPKARTDLVKADEELERVREQLDGDSDITVANAALVLSHCAQVAGVSRALADTDVVRALLSKTDTVSPAVKENCAIALAKLATTEERNLQRLRDLGGIGILHSCMKYVKS